MRDVIARWMIGRAADGDRSVPSWVRRRMARNPSLMDYEQQSRALVSRLRSEAGGFARRSARTSQVVSLRQSSNRERRHRLSQVAVVVAVAAVLILLLLPRGGGRLQEDLPGHQPSDAMVAQRRAQAVTVAKFVGAQAAVMQRVWDSTEDFGSRVARLRPRPLSAARWLTDQTEDAGRSAGEAINQTVAAFGRSVLREQKKLWDAVRPFTDAFHGLLPDEIPSEEVPSDGPDAVK